MWSELVCSCSNLISPVDLVCASHSVSDFEVDGPQTPSVSRKRGASVALEREQHKRAKSKHGSGTSPAEACAQKDAVQNGAWVSQEQSATCSRRNKADVAIGSTA